MRLGQAGDIRAGARRVDGVRLGARRIWPPQVGPGVPQAFAPGTVSAVLDEGAEGDAVVVAIGALPEGLGLAGWVEISFDDRASWVVVFAPFIGQHVLPVEPFDGLLPVHVRAVTQAGASPSLLVATLAPRSRGTLDAEIRALHLAAPDGGNYRGETEAAGFATVTATTAAEVWQEVALWAAGPLDGRTRIVCDWDGIAEGPDASLRGFADSRLTSDASKFGGWQRPEGRVWIAAAPQRTPVIGASRMHFAGFPYLFLDGVDFAPQLPAGGAANAGANRFAIEASPVTGYTLMQNVAVRGVGLGLLRHRPSADIIRAPSGILVEGYAAHVEDCAFEGLWNPVHLKCKFPRVFRNFGRKLINDFARNGNTLRNAWQGEAINPWVEGNVCLDYVRDTRLTGYHTDYWQPVFGSDRIAELRGICHRNLYHADMAGIENSQSQGIFAGDHQTIRMSMSVQDNLFAISAYHAVHVHDPSGRGRWHVRNNTFARAGRPQAPPANDVFPQVFINDRYSIAQGLAGPASAGGKVVVEDNILARVDAGSVPSRIVGNLYVDPRAATGAAGTGAAGSPLRPEAAFDGVMTRLANGRLSYAVPGEAEARDYATAFWLLVDFFRPQAGYGAIGMSDPTTWPEAPARPSLPPPSGENRAPDARDMTITFVIPPKGGVVAGSSYLAKGGANLLSTATDPDGDALIVGAVADRTSGNPISVSGSGFRLDVARDGAPTLVTTGGDLPGHPSTQGAETTILTTTWRAWDGSLPSPGRALTVRIEAATSTPGGGADTPLTTANLKRYMEWLPTSPIVGRTSATALKAPTAALPWAVISGTTLEIKANAPAIVEDFDFRGYRIFCEASNVLIRQNLFGHRTGMTGKGAYLSIRAACVGVRVENNRFTDTKKDGAHRALVQLTAGSSPNLTTSRDLTMRRNVFEFFGDDYCKFFGSLLEEENVYLQGFTHDESVRPYSETKDYAIGEKIVQVVSGSKFQYSAKRSGVLSAPPTNKTSNTDWQSIDPHLDTRTYHAGIGPIVSRFNYIDCNTDYVVGFTNPARISRNTGTTPLFEDIDIVGEYSTSDKKWRNYCFMFNRHGENWPGRIRVRHCFVGGNYKGLHYYPVSDTIQQVHVWDNVYDTDSGAPVKLPRGAVAQSTPVPQPPGWTAFVAAMGGGSSGGETALPVRALAVLGQSEPRAIFAYQNNDLAHGPMPPLPAENLTVATNHHNHPGTGITVRDIKAADVAARTAPRGALALARLWHHVYPGQHLVLADMTKAGTSPGALFDASEADVTTGDRPWHPVPGVVAAAEGYLRSRFGDAHAFIRDLIWYWWNAPHTQLGSFDASFSAMLTGQNPDGTTHALGSGSVAHCMWDLAAASGKGRGVVDRRTRLGIVYPGVRGEPSLAARRNSVYREDGSRDGGHARSFSVEREEVSTVPRTAIEGMRHFLGQPRLAPIRGGAGPSPIVQLFGDYLPGGGSPQGGDSGIHAARYHPQGVAYMAMHAGITAMIGSGDAYEPTIMGHQTSADGLTTTLRIGLPNGGTLSTARKRKGLVSPVASLADHQHADGTGFEVRRAGAGWFDMRYVARTGTGEPASCQATVTIVNAGTGTGSARYGEVRIVWAQPVVAGDRLYHHQSFYYNAQRSGLDYHRWLWADYLIEAVPGLDDGSAWGYPGIPVSAQRDMATMTLQPGGGYVGATTNGGLGRIRAGYEAAGGTGGGAPPPPPPPTDVTPPERVDRVPIRDSTNAPVNVVPYLTFTEEVVIRVGAPPATISTGGAVVASLGPTDPGLRAVGDAVYFGFGALQPGTPYVIAVPNGLVTDRAGNPYEGTSAWRFTTAQSFGPAVASTTPGDGAAPNTSLRITFNQAVAAVPGGRVEVVRTGTTDVLFALEDVSASPAVTIEGNIVEIGPSGIPASTAITWRIGPNVFATADGQAITWANNLAAAYTTGSGAAAASANALSTNGQATATGALPTANTLSRTGQATAS